MFFESNILPRRSSSVFPALLSFAAYANVEYRLLSNSARSPYVSYEIKRYLREDFTAYIPLVKEMVK